MGAVWPHPSLEPCGTASPWCRRLEAAEVLLDYIIGLDNYHGYIMDIVIYEWYIVDISMTYHWYIWYVIDISMTYHNVMNCKGHILPANGLLFGWVWIVNDQLSLDSRIKHMKLVIILVLITGYPIIIICLLIISFNIPDVWFQMSDRITFRTMVSGGMWTMRGNSHDRWTLMMLMWQT